MEAGDSGHGSKFTATEVTEFSSVEVSGSVHGSTSKNSTTTLGGSFQELPHAPKTFPPLPRVL